MARAPIVLGRFVLNPDRGTLHRDGTAIPVSHRGFVLLRMLLDADGAVVPKHVLIDAAWPDAQVEESNLTVQIAALRKVLGRSPDGEEWIATVPRVGYRLVRPADAPGDRNAPHFDRDRPAIAILPFINLGGDPEQGYFADGLAEDLITDLSKVPGLMVIARNSSFAHRGSEVDVPAVSRALGVRYVVEGSVRRAATRLRINAQLIDVAGNVLLWADRFDRDLGDVFAIQDEIVRRIVDALSGVLPRSGWPAARRATRIEAYDLFVRGRALVIRSADGSLAAQPLFSRAIEIDPDFADAHAWLAISLVFGWLYSGDPIERYGAGVAAARRAVSLDPNNAGAHAILGLLLVYGGRLEEASDQLAAALRIDPNHADGWLFRACLKVNQGRPEEGIENVRTAFLLNPQPQGLYHWILGYAQYAAGRYQEAVDTLVHPVTRRTLSQRILAAALAQLGRHDEAKAEAREFLAANPHFTITHWAATDHFDRESDRQHFVDGYLKAGLPM
jgi:TolB-like protein